MHGGNAQYPAGPVKEDRMLEKIWNHLLFRFMRARKAVEKIAALLGPQFTEDMIVMLLDGMCLLFLISDRYRRNIEQFEGRYVFRSMDGSFAVSALFQKGKMKVRKGETDDPDITVNFKNSQALMNFIFSPKPDVLNAMLNQDVVLDGNLNYLYKFAYMANHVRLKGPELLAG